MASVLGFCSRIWQIVSPPVAPKTEGALKFGILGAAKIAPVALISPAKSHPDVIVQAVAARNKDKATRYAKKHGIPRVLDSYQAIIDDLSIDCVYIPLPNGLHYEWTLKALAAGKHVLLEKPSVSNRAEAEILFRHPALQGPDGPVLLEAFHYRFQPAWRYFLSLLDPAAIVHAHAHVFVPHLAFDKDDIRFQYDLAGGALMDLGTYPLSALRGVFAAEPDECLSCEVVTMPSPEERCDHTFKARWRFPNGGTADIEGSLQGALRQFGPPVIEVTHRPAPVADASLPEGQEKLRTRKVTMRNFIVANFWHRIDIEDEFVVQKTDGSGEVLKRWTVKASKKAYTFREAGGDEPGEVYWLSYRHQLEQFVNRVRGREGSGLWIEHEDSIAQARMIDMAYEKCGLGLRPTSEYRLNL